MTYIHCFFTPLAIALLLSMPAHAQCNVHKATRNAMLKNTIGISGNCNTSKVVTQGIDHALNNHENKTQKPSAKKDKKTTTSSRHDGHK